jgi:uncharacterized OB-fold protein
MKEFKPEWELVDLEIIGEKAGVITLHPEGSPYLLASRCLSCGKYSFPQKKVCPFCMRFEEITIEEVGATGKIDSFTECHVAPKGFKAPYHLGIVEVEHGLKVTTIIDSENLDLLQKGAEVELIISSTSFDEQAINTTGWKYRIKKEGI